MLESLLRPPPAGPPGKAEGQQAPPPPVVRAVAIALGANNTEAARQTLARLLAGEFAGVDRSAVAEDAVAALLRQDSTQSEQIVLRHLVAPPSTEAEPGKPAAVAAGQDHVLAAVRTYGSRRLRKLLAEAVIDGTVPVAQRKALLTLLCEANSRNLDAQTLLYQSESVDAAMRAALAKHFVAASTERSKRCWGLRAGNPRTGRPRPHGATASADCFGGRP